MTDAGALHTPAHSPVRPPQPWKGAWGGAWLVVYASLVLCKAAFVAGVYPLLAHLCDWGAVATRVQGIENEDREAIDRVADFVQGVPAAMGADLLPAAWVDLGLATVLLVVAFGVIRRSEAARKVAVGAVVLEALWSVSVSVWWAVHVLPIHERWAAQGREILEETRRAGGGAQQTVDLLNSLLGAGGRPMLLLSEGTTQAIHLAILAALAVRLAGASSRLWCGSPGTRGRPIASSGGRG